MMSAANKRNHFVLLGSVDVKSDPTCWHKFLDTWNRERHIGSPCILMLQKTGVVRAYGTPNSFSGNEEPSRIVVHCTKRDHSDSAGRLTLEEGTTVTTYVAVVDVVNC